MFRELSSVAPNKIDMLCFHAAISKQRGVSASASSKTVQKSFPVSARGEVCRGRGPGATKEAILFFFGASPCKTPGPRSCAPSWARALKRSGTQLPRWVDHPILSFFGYRCHYTCTHRPKTYNLYICMCICIRKHLI